MVKKEHHQTFSFAQYENRAGQRKQIMISKSGRKVILDESQED